MLPCIETYTKVDLRTVSFDVPPQEVGGAKVGFKISLAPASYGPYVLHRVVIENTPVCDRRFSMASSEKVAENLQ